MFTLGPAFALFIVVWIHDDAGIGYTNKEKVKNTGEFIEYRSLGGWYHQFLKGYAGIGVIFAFYTIINMFFTNVLSGSSDVGQATTLFIIIIPIPIFGILAAIPTLLILDMFREKSVNYARNMAKKIGITEELIYSEE